MPHVPKLVYLQKTYERLQPLKLHDLKSRDKLIKFILIFTRLMGTKFGRILISGRMLRT